MCKRIGKIAIEEAREFFFNTKMILIIFELIFICESFLSNVKELSVVVGDKLSYFEPYLLVANSDMFFLAIPFVYMVLLLEFPSKKGMNYFTLIRISKLEWMLGEFLFLIISVVGYLFIIMVGLFWFMRGRLIYHNTWSEYMLHFYKKQPDLYLENLDYFLKANMMTHGTPLFVFFHSILLLICMLFCIAQMQMLFALLKKKNIGILVIILCTFGTSLEIYNEKTSKWMFPMTHMNFGIHYNGIRAQENMSLGISYMYFAILSIIFLGCILHIFKNINLE